MPWGRVDGALCQSKARPLPCGSRERGVLVRVYRCRAFDTQRRVRDLMQSEERGGEKKSDRVTGHTGVPHRV